MNTVPTRQALVKAWFVPTKNFFHAELFSLVVTIFT